MASAGRSGSEFSSILEAEKLNPFAKKVAAGNVTKARSVVEKGRLRNPGNDLLWMKAVSIYIQETL